jgi:DNA-binding GntR family transcriptional regulator
MNEMLRDGPAMPERGESLRHQIYNDLRDKLRRGTIGPADRLVDVNIAKALGVSRMPVREALLQLISEGHLVGTTRGFVLPELTPQDIGDIFEVRKLLEPRAAANAARDLREEGVASLREALDHARRAVAQADGGELAAANVAFRQTWLDALRNRRLAETISRFADQAQIVRLETLMDPATQIVVREGMTGLYDAFSRGDTIAAQDRMTAFIAEAEKSYFRSLESSMKAPGGAADPGRGRRKAGHA